MLDRITGELLNVLNGFCEGGSYKVVTVEELISAMPKKMPIHEDALRESLKALQKKDFIRVKYEDEVEFCLCTLPKGRFFYENKQDEAKDVASVKRKYFLYSFFGGFSGSAFCIAVAALLYVFLR